MDTTPEQQLVKYLTDAHSIERQALVQMRAAPKIAGTPELEALFAAHLLETEQHEQRVRERLVELGAEPSRMKDIAGAAGGYAMVLFARVQPDTPGKLTAHAFAYEHMEYAAYDLLRRFALRVGDHETADLAESIGAQELAMAERLAGCFDVAARASLAGKDVGQVESALDTYLADAHAIEMQALQLLQASPMLAGESRLAAAFAEHLQETRGQVGVLEKCIDARDGRRSLVKDAVLRLGALNLGAFHAVQPDTPVKLAGFAYAFEHLEIAAYELLLRVARTAGDDDVAEAARLILAQERHAAESVHDCFDAAVESVLEHHVVG